MNVLWESFIGVHLGRKVSRMSAILPERPAVAQSVEHLEESGSPANMSGCRCEDADVLHGLGSAA